MQIKTIQQLRKLASAEDGLECFIRLKHGLISRKKIDFVDGFFYVFNHIDESEQQLSEQQILDDKYTNIGKAMRRGALIKDD